MKFGAYLRCTVFGATALYAAVSSAQTVVPNAARPEILERQLRIEDTRPEVGGAPIISDQRQGKVTIEGGYSFTLKDIDFEGLNVFSEADLEALYADRIGSKLTLSELSAIVDSITTYYRNNGYILSRAILPAQRIGASGRVKIQIVEGGVNNVILEGDEVAKKSVIHKYVQRIRNAQPITSETLERYLLLMEDLPGVTARAVIAKAENPTSQGAVSDIIITITRDPFEAAFDFDNRGSRFLGQYQAAITLTANNVLGIDEQTQFRFINTPIQYEELRFGEIRHEQQLGDDGLTLVLSGSYTKTAPGSSIEALDIEGDNINLTAGLNYPIIRSRQSNWFVNGDFTTRNTETTTFDTLLNKDELKVFTLGTAYDFVDDGFAINRMEASVSQGVNFDVNRDGNDARSRNNGETSFTKINARISRLQPVSGPWTAFFAASGQYSADPLLAAEEFAIGGVEFGSAYDPAEIVGDSGLAARTEMQYNATPTDPLLTSVQLYGFLDGGKVWNRDIVADSEVDAVSLMSTGLGARFNISDSISGNFEGAMPLTKDVAANGADGSAPRLFFSMQYRY